MKNNDRPELITREPRDRPIYRWHCPTCGNTGNGSQTRRLALLALHHHWKKCPPNPA